VRADRPEIAAISTMMIGVTTVLFLLSQLLGTVREH
jgi:hypothetical protein